VLNTPCYILSDAHLGFAPKEVEQAIISFLRHVATHGRALVINGDLFEFWFEWLRSFLAADFERSPPCRRRRRRRASRDDRGQPRLWGGDVLRRDVGVDYRFGPWRDEIGRGARTSNTGRTAPR
jgi:UDP-2,3-diacylglucosamine hydrolase